MREYSLVGIDGNAFSVMGYVKRCMKESKLSESEQSDYTKKAMSGDYNNLLRVSQDVITKLNDALCENKSRSRKE